MVSLKIHFSMFEFSVLFSETSTARWGKGKWQLTKGVWGPRCASPPAPFKKSQEDNSEAKSLVCKVPLFLSNHSKFKFMSGSKVLFKTRWRSHAFKIWFLFTYLFYFAIRHSTFFQSHEAWAKVCCFLPSWTAWCVCERVELLLPIIIPRSEQNARELQQNVGAKIWKLPHSRIEFPSNWVYFLMEAIWDCAEEHTAAGLFILTANVRGILIRAKQHRAAAETLFLWGLASFINVPKEPFTQPAGKLITQETSFYFDKMYCRPIFGYLG